jgi:putative cell wall-binding protein
MVLATAGTAMAATVAVTTQVAGATAVYPGANAQAISDYALDFANSFHIGDTITVVLGGGDCSTTNAAIGFSAAPTVTTDGPSTGAFGSSAGSTTDTKPTFTTALSSSAGACTTAGVKDTLTFTFTNSSTGTATDHFQVTLSGQNVNVGSAVPAGGNVTEAANGGAADVVANVLDTKVVVSAVTPGSTGTTVGLGTITASDVTTKAAIDGTKLIFTLTNGTWVGKGTLTGPSGLTYDSGVIAGSTLTYTSTAGTVPNALNSYKLSGATAQFTAPGDVTVDVTDNGGNAAGGTEQVGVAATVTHNGGIDRYATAASLYQANFSGSSVAVLASGANFPDALSANVLASDNGTGILLTDPNVLSGATLQVLKADAIDTVYIVGGPKAVSSAIETQIGAMHIQNNPASGLINVIRVAGADRYGTNNAVDLTTFTGTQPFAVVASGAAFPDALAVGPLVWDNDWPLVLTDAGSLNPAAQSSLVNMGVTHVVILGGTSAVSSAVETAIKGLGITIDYRVAGADRTATAAQIATWATDGLPATTTYSALAALGWNLTSVDIARGDNFADALAAGPAGGNNGALTLLTSTPSILGAGIPSIFGAAGAGGTGVHNINVLGLAAAVNPSTVNAAILSLG